MAHQEVAFGRQRHEVELEASRGRLDAQSGVRHAAGDVGRHRRMGEFALLEAGDAHRIDVGIVEQAVQQEARARAPLAVDEVDVGSRQVAHAVDLARIARRDHQALMARRHVDQPRAARIEPARVVRQRALLVSPLRDRQPRQVAGAVVQRRRGLLARHVPALDRHARRREELEQPLDREAMARVNAELRRRGAHDALDLHLELGGQAVEHRRQPRKDAVARPHQLLRQRRQRGTLAALHQQQRRAELLLALAHERPRVAVRRPVLAADARQRALLVHLRQQLEQARRHALPVGAADRPLRLDRHDMHAGSSLGWRRHKDRARENITMHRQKHIAGCRFDN